MTSIRAMPASVWIFSLFTGGYMVFYYPMFLVIGQVIIGRGLGDPVAVGYAMTFFSVASLAAGVCFGFLARWMKNTILCFSLFGIAISAAGIYFAGSYAMVCLFLAIGGFAATCILPACNNVYFRQVPPQRSFLASSITLSALNIGAFLGTPYISLIEAFGGEPMTCLLISPVFLVVMGLISIRVMKKGQRLDA